MIDISIRIKATIIVRKINGMKMNITPLMTISMTAMKMIMSLLLLNDQITVSEQNPPKIKPTITQLTSTPPHIPATTALQPQLPMTPIRSLVPTMRPTQVHQFKNGSPCCCTPSAIIPMAFVTTITTIPSSTSLS